MLALHLPQAQWCTSAPASCTAAWRTPRGADRRQPAWPDPLFGRTSTPTDLARAGPSEAADRVAVNERAEQALLPMLNGCPACCRWPASFAARRSP